MDRSEELKQMFAASRLPEKLEIKKLHHYTTSEFTALRFVTNVYRIRALEIWEGGGRPWLRIYHSEKMATELKQLVEGLGDFERKSSTANYVDFFGDFNAIIIALGDLLAEPGTERIANNSQVLSRNGAYEGLTLPDVDVSEIDVLGRTFTWRELLALDEDNSPDNALKRTLSQSGVYLQRSPDGRTRYVGAAFGDGGILGRWLKHLTSNGSAKHLNLYVLENGYANVLFTVLEFTADALGAETRWKATLGTRNAGPYDGFRLNSN